MFTGIVLNVADKTSKIRGDGIEISITTKDRHFTDIQIGESIAVNGVCLTVEKWDALTGEIIFFASEETCRLTNLSNSKTKCNLERALKISDRLSGHIVQGHIDGMAKYISIVKNDESYKLTIELPTSLSKYVVSKGSICIDGISLTANGVLDKKHSSLIDFFVIPHTYENTTLKYSSVGDLFNIEVDVVAKYVERLSKYNGSH